MTLSKLIEILEEFFNSDSFHDNGVLESVLDICRIVGYLDSLLHETVIDNIQTLSGIWEVGGTCLSQLTMMEWSICLWVFSCVLNEDILRSVNISAEFEIVDLSNITSVEVLSNQNLEEFFLWWN